MSFTLAVTVLLGDELRGLHLPGGSLLALGVAVGEVVERLPLTGSPLADLLDGLQVLHDVHLAVEEPVGRPGAENLVKAHIDHLTLGAVVGRSGRGSSRAFWPEPCRAF